MIAAAEDNKLNELNTHQQECVVSSSESRTSRKSGFEFKQVSLRNECKNRYGQHTTAD